MKVIAINKFHGEFVEQQVDIPPVKPGDVRIKIHATAFNPVDYKIRHGKFGGDFPLILGHDASGVIDGVGEGVTDFKVGDQVYSFVFGTPKSNGAYAEYVSLPQQFVALKPSSISFEEAAAIPLVGLTAYEVIKRAQDFKGKTVFVTGASGGVGSLIVPMLRHFGASAIIATAGGAASAEYIEKHLGIKQQHIIRYDQLNDDQIVQKVKEINGGKGLRFSIDLVGGRMKTLAFHVLGLFGHILTIVEEDDPNFATPLYPSQAAEKALFMHNGTLSTIFIGASAIFGSGPEDWQFSHEGLALIAKLIDNKEINPPKIENVGKLSAEVVEKAHKELEAGHTKGKLVMTVN